MFFQKIREKRLAREIKEKKKIDEIHDAEEKMVLFAEGKISTYDFWTLFLKDEKIRNTLMNDPKLPKIMNKDPNKPFLYNIDIRRLSHRCEVFRAVKVYFLRRNIMLNFNNEDSKEYVELLNVAPRYVDVDGEWFNDKIFTKCKLVYGTKERKEWLKNKIREFYRYENKPPRWLQNPEWPIGEDGPLVFKKQSAYPNNVTDDFIDYYFDDNGKEVVVRQYD